jgi:MFS family permease
MPDRSTEHEPSAARNLYAFGFTSFLNDTASEMAYWVLPAFLASLGAGPAQLGLIEGVAESVASFAKLFSGYLTDRIDRRKPVVVAGYFAANAVKPLLALTTAWRHILLIRFTDRLAKGVRGAPRDVMVAESVPKGRLGSAYGLIQAMDSAGAIAGPLAALVLLARFGIRSVFWAASVPGALCVLVALLGIRETRRSNRRDPALAASTPQNPPVSSAAEKGSVKFPASYYIVLIAVTLFSLGNSSDMFLVLRAQNVGIAVALAPLLGLVFNITYTLAS